MSKWRKLWIRVKEEDLRKVDMVANVLCISRTAAIRACINNNTIPDRNNWQNATQVAIKPKPP